MANSPQARKRARQSERRRYENAALRSRFRTYIKKVIKAIEAGDRQSAAASYERATPVIDGMVNKGLVHRNKAARHKSRLNARIRQMNS